MNHSQFRTVFEQLTGNPPLAWQERLFHKHFAKNDLPRAIDLPTGLGKTMVMAIWLIAWAVNDALARRLIYVVKRRTVVDQATDLASLLWQNASQVLPSIAKLAVIGLCTPNEPLHVAKPRKLQGRAGRDGSFSMQRPVALFADSSPTTASGCNTSLGQPSSLARLTLSAHSVIFGMEALRASPRALDYWHATHF